MPQLSYSAPLADGPLDAVVRLPGSKSLTNRELVLASLADGPSRLRAPLRARDTELMAGALRSLGATIDEDEESWIVGPLGVDAAEPPASVGARRDETARRIDVGLAGTVMRFVPPIAGLVPGATTLDGDEAARRRPMSTMTTALRSLGIEVEGDALPLTVHGTGAIRGGELEIDASASSQFVSGLLLAAPRFELGLVLRHRGERVPSTPHIEMTLECLRARGVDVGSPEPGVWAVAPGPIAARDVAIEPDLSNAGPFLAAALAAGGSVTVEGWPRGTSQVGDDLRHLLPRFGAIATWRDERLTVTRSAPIHGLGDIDLADDAELVPPIVGLAALADSPSRITGIGHMRGHETDRLAALADGINGLGGRVTVLADGLAIEPAPLHGGPWEVRGDFRMAMTGALIGLAVPGVVLDDLGAMTKTLPEFRQLWERMLGR